MKIYFFRHMPTANNLLDKFLGHLDLDYSIDYALEHSEEIENIVKMSNQFSTIYCSPLKRAKHTAETIFPNRGVIIDDRLIERDLGTWSNVSKSELRKKYSEAFYANGRLNFWFTPAGGETFYNLIVRISNFLFEIYNKYNNDNNIAVVTHNGVITTIKCIENRQFNDTSNFSFQPYLKPYILNLNLETANYVESLSQGQLEIFK